MHRWKVDGGGRIALHGQAGGFQRGLGLRQFRHKPLRTIPANGVAHIGQGLARDLLDFADFFSRPLRIAVDQFACEFGLQRNDRQSMSKNVMQITRNPFALGDLGQVLYFFVRLAQFAVHPVALGEENIAAAHDHARQAVTAIPPPTFEFLDQAKAKEVAAMARQILPSDDGPGADEAGVVYFIDRALATFDSDKRDAYRQGLSDLSEGARKISPSASGLAELANAQQLELLRSIEKSDFFELVRTHTLMGFLGDPSYDGNHNKVGWKHIGFEDKMSFQPPFGYYDAEGK